MVYLRFNLTVSLLSSFILVGGWALIVLDTLKIGWIRRANFAVSLMMGIEYREWLIILLIGSVFVIITYRCNVITLWAG